VASLCCKSFCSSTLFSPSLVLTITIDLLCLSTVSISYNNFNAISGVMVNLLFSSRVGHGSEP
jgi:hypothetical protein